MDPFTQRMLERARARQEKIDQKLASTGQVVPKRKPLTENIPPTKAVQSPTKTPSKTSKDSVLSPKRTSKEFVKSSPSGSPCKKLSKTGSVSSPRRKDVVVTKKEFDTPKRGSKRNSDVSVEINIMHRDDIQIEVQVEERDLPLTVYDSTSDKGSVIIKEIDGTSKGENHLADMENRTDKSGLRHNVKSRLDRLGVLYSDKPDLSSPIHRTELDFTAGTPPSVDQKTKTPRPEERSRDGKKKFGRLAALADQINNWEDDLTHHSSAQPEPVKKPSATTKRQAHTVDKDASTLDVSLHSLNDINKVLNSAKSKETKPVNSRTYTKQSSNDNHQLDKKIVAQLEGEGYRRVSASQSRLVYDFAATKKADRVRQEPKPASTTPSATAAPNMAAMVASNPPTVAKKPSIKKYKAPTPPVNANGSDDDSCESDKDKENNVIEREELDNDSTVCKQTKAEPAVDNRAERGSPVVKRLAPKLNADRSSVLSKAAMFEAGSPRAKEKDPAEMSLRERKALFEKNKGVAIVPKAPFGQAPSVKTLLGDKAETPKPVRPVTAPKPILKSSEVSRCNSKENIPDDNQPIVGIKGKLAALFNKEQTISESSITNKFKQEREREMEMLQNRFQYKPKNDTAADGHESDGDHSDHNDDGSENAPLMGSTVSLTQASRKPEIIANIPKERVDNAMSGSNREPEIVAAQPHKRRSSQDSPVVLSVLEDVKRIKVNDKKDAKTNGAIQNPGLYPHLSDIETDNSHTQEEYSDCGNSSEDPTEKLNKSDDWAETSFGREVMNVVKKRNNSSYKKAVASDYDTSNSDMNSELDDLLDEALDESEGLTPPKVNKNANTLSSKSFVYEGGSSKKQFKSPLKLQDTPRHDRGNELIHSVSFYRRMQNAGSQPSTPMRVVRHASPPRDPPEELTVNVTTVRERIKELQAEIAKQQTVISQASQALNLCASTVEFSGSTEQAEGERLLLLATHRRQACLHEVQRLQVEGAGKGAKQGHASIVLQGISVPLRRDYIRQLNADGAVGHHCVCLVKCGDRVVATVMRDTKPDSNILTFPDEIRMDGLHSDFKVTIEVYLLQASKEVLPHNVKYHISNKKSSKLLTPKSKVAELKTPRTQSPGGPLAVRSPQLSSHGYCIFAAQQAGRKAFTLSKVPCGSPLEGSINLSIKARIMLPPPPPHSAFLTAFDDVSGLGAWHRRWYKLTTPRLAYWKYPEDVHKKMPIGDIDLTTITTDKVTVAPRDLCARPNTILFETSVPTGLIVPETDSLVYVRKQDGRVARRHLLAADTKQDRDVWLDTLNQALEYVRCMGSDDE